MKKLKLSQWHSGDVKPVHNGVYEGWDNESETFYYSYWDTTSWNGWWSSIDTCLLNLGFVGFQSQIDKWRGIVK